MRQYIFREAETPFDWASAARSYSCYAKHIDAAFILMNEHKGHTDFRPVTVEVINNDSRVFKLQH